MSRHEERLLDHEYDGISEYDNPTPGWWHFIFLGSVLFSAIYAAFWHSSPMSWTPYEALAADEKAYYGRLFKDLGDLQPDEPTMVKLMADQKWMAFGGSLFAANCSQCHASNGSGITGPNLTDDRWINVKKLADVYAVISEGVGTKGMPAWKNRLGLNERILVSSYVASLRSNPVPGKAPEGEHVDPWTVASATGAATEQHATTQ